jgi:hypothetical protein
MSDSNSEFRLYTTYGQCQYGKVNTTNKNRHFIGASKVSLEVNVEKTRYMLKNAVFWDVMQCGSSKNRRFAGN